MAVRSMGTLDFRTDGEALFIIASMAIIIMIAFGGITIVPLPITIIISTEVITEVITIMYITTGVWITNVMVTETQVLIEVV